MTALQGRRLAGAVAAEQRHDLALGHRKAHAVQHMRFAVPGVEIGDPQQRRRVAPGAGQAWPVPI